MAIWYELASVHAYRCHGIRGKMSARDIAYNYNYQSVSKCFDSLKEATEAADKLFKARPEALDEVRTEIVERDELGFYAVNFRYFAIYRCTDGAIDRVAKVWAQPITDKMIRAFNRN